MQLEEIITGNERFFRVSSFLFNKLKEEALEKSKKYNLEIILIDFENPKNLYTQNLYAWIGPYTNRNILWFHENVRSATQNMLQLARAHTQEDEQGHKFITTFKQEDLDENRSFGSLYSNIWGRCISEKFEEYIQQKLSEIKNVLTEHHAKEKNKPLYLNIVGDHGTGKTTLLHYLSKSKLFGTRIGYNTLECYIHQNQSAQSIAADIQTRNPSPILLLDEANVAPDSLFQLLAPHYQCIIYASQTPLPKEYEIKKTIQLNKSV